MPILPEARPDRPARRRPLPSEPAEAVARHPSAAPQRRTAGTVRARASAVARPRRAIPEDVDAELRSQGDARLAARLERRLTAATGAYERDRYGDAATTLRELVGLAPASPSVRELYGLCFYRLGRWKEARRQLYSFHELTGSLDQHPVLADCERALGNHDVVAELWAEVRTGGVSSDLLAEGRIVMAGSLADRGELEEAIALLLPAARRAIKHPEQRHLRQWYALADLYERASDVPKARELFRRVVDSDPELADAGARLAALV